MDLSTGIEFFDYMANDCDARMDNEDDINKLDYYQKSATIYTQFADWLRELQAFRENVSRETN